MLEVANLVKEYKSLRAVDGLSFVIQPGEIVGLLGPNGAGKTTALRCVAGILRPTAGEIRINGHNLIHDQGNAKAGLAFVPELPSLYELLTVDEHLRFVAMCFNQLPLYEERGEMLLRRYNLLEKRNALVATLSKGMKQKLAIACAFVHEANVLLFDEPIIGIDPAGVAQVKAEIVRARDSGCAILVSTHLLDTAERLCDRVIIVSRGRKLAEGTLTELQQQSGMAGVSLEDVFLKLTAERDETPVVFDV
jgi:ABC-2 type transport system ATP-binding protein